MPSELIKKFANHSRDIESPRHAALTIFHALYDARVLPALGTWCRFCRIHDRFPVGSLCNFRHSNSPDRNVPPAKIHRPRFYLVIGEDRSWTTVVGRQTNSGPSRISRAESIRAEAVHCTRLQNLTRIAAATSHRRVAENSILFLLLGGAAVHRCDKRPIFRAGFRWDETAGLAERAMMLSAAHSKCKLKETS